MPAAKNGGRTAFDPSPHTETGARGRQPDVSRQMGGKRSGMPRSKMVNSQLTPRGRKGKKIGLPTATNWNNGAAVGNPTLPMQEADGGAREGARRGPEEAREKEEGSFDTSEPLTG